MAMLGNICRILRFRRQKKLLLLVVAVCYIYVTLVHRLPDDRNLSYPERGKYELRQIRKKIEHFFEYKESNDILNPMKGKRMVLISKRNSDKKPKKKYRELPKAIGFQTNKTVSRKSVGVPKDLKIVNKTFKLKPEVKLKEEEDRKCNFNLLSFDDSRVDEDYGTCTFPRVTSEDAFDAKINNMENISLPLLANYRNPCWFESLPLVNQYRGKVHMFWFQVKKSFDRMMPVLQNRRKLHHLWRLRCLPLVYIIGLSKCGVTDLHYSLLQHPHAAAAATKEPFYWSRDRWKWSSPIADYLDLFDEAAERIRTLTIPDNSRQVAARVHHPMVTLDGSVNYLYEFGGLEMIKEQKPDIYKEGPKHIMPHLIRLLTPNTDIKIILTLRNPTERLFKVYCLHQAYEKVSPARFHTVVGNQIKVMKRCLENRSLIACVYDKTVTKVTDKIELFSGIYHVFVQGWMEVFPKMKIILWEDYKVNKKSIFLDLLNYINLDPKLMKAGIANSVINEDNEDSVEMLPKTEKMLDEFYRPHNEKLADLLNDKRFKFESQ